MSTDNNFCASCGAPLNPGVSFCPRCGAAVSGTGSAGSQSGGQSTDWREQRRIWKAQRWAERYEKYEKGEKHQEKTEKGSRGGMIGSLTGGSILIWLGITFYLQQIGYLDSSTWWAYFLAGIGVIIIIQGLINYSISRGSFMGSLIGGAILFLMGSLIGGAILFLIRISFIANIGQNFWPLILIIIGIVVLFSGLGARKRRPRPSPPSA